MALDVIKYRKKLTHSAHPYPRFLYKYKSPAPIPHLRDIIVHSRLWYSIPKDFNDPFDTKVKTTVSGSPQEIIKRIEKALKRSSLGMSKRVAELEAAKQYAQLRRNKTDLVRLAQNSHEQTMGKAGIICFSEDPRNILLWSHYTKHHQGVCFQFDIVKDVNNFVTALPVKYADDDPAHDWVKDDDRRLLDGIYTKFSDWKYEKERRITIPDRGHSYLNFEPPALRGLIYGSKMDESVRYEIRKLLEERKQKSLSTIKEYQAIQSEDSYNLYP